MFLLERDVALGEMPAYKRQSLARGSKSSTTWFKSLVTRDNLVHDVLHGTAWHHTIRVLSHVALKPLVKKQLSAWRPITARLILLRKLVSEFGLESGSGLAADSIMNFIQVSGGQDNSWPSG